MDVSSNKFKQALKGETPQFGLWMGLPDSICAEIGAGAGFDWLLIDTEHAPYSLRDVQNHLQAIAPYNVPAIVRPTEGRTALIKQLLDIGAQTLLIPMVDNAEHARQLVKDVRYPPQGIRGLGTSMARAAKWNRTADYLQKANQEICLVVQVETIDAIHNLEEIVAVEGVDAIFIGPSDLSASMGHLGNPGHPDVVAVIEQAFKIIIKAGKAPGVLAVEKGLADDYVAKGAKFVGVGVDAALLSKATSDLAQTFIGTKATKIAGY